MDSVGSQIENAMFTQNAERNFLSFQGVSIGLAPDYHHSERIVLRIDKAFHSEYSRKDSREDFKFSLFTKFIINKLGIVDEGYLYLINYLIDNNLR